MPACFRHSENRDRTAFNTPVHPPAIPSGGQHDVHLRRQRRSVPRPIGRETAGHAADAQWVTARIGNAGVRAQCAFPDAEERAAVADRPRTFVAPSVSSAADSRSVAVSMSAHPNLSPEEMISLLPSSEVPPTSGNWR